MLHTAILCVALLAPAALPKGDGKIAVDVGPVVLDVFTYRPAGYKNGPLIVSFHGVGRNADGYRDAAKPLADAMGALVVAPLFDEKRFPTSLYQRGGVMTKDGKAAPASERTYALANTLVQKVRQGEGRPDMPVYFIGHSAGGQFLVRLAAFGEKVPAVRIIAANPGSQLFPTTDLPYPYGLGGLPKELRDETMLRHFFAAPLTLLLGSADIVRDKDLDVSADADKQGPDRWTRSHRAFEMARDMAKSHGWAFNWKIVVVPDVGHSASKMFRTPQALAALRD